MNDVSGRFPQHDGPDSYTELGRRYEKYGETGHGLDPDLVRAWRHFFSDLGVIDAGAVDGYFLEQEFGRERLMRHDATQTVEYIIARVKQRTQESDTQLVLSDVMKEFVRFEYEVEQQEQFENAYSYLGWIGIRREQLDMLAMSTDATLKNSVRRLARIMRDGSMALLVERLREQAPVHSHDFFDVFECALQMMRENNLVGEMVDSGEHEEMLKNRRGAVAAAVRKMLFDGPDTL